MLGFNPLSQRPISNQPLDSSAAVSTVTDNFDDNSINAIIWNTRIDANITSVSETGGQLVVTPNGAGFGYGGLTTVDAALNLKNSSFYVKVPTIVNAVAGAETILSAYIDGTAEISFVVGGGAPQALIPRYRIGSVNNDNGYPAYNATNHVWWRIREASGTMYWETSINGTTWATHHSQAHTYTDAQLAAVQIRLLAGQYGFVTGPGTSVFDNLNVAPSVTTNSDNFFLMF